MIILHCFDSLNEKNGFITQYTEKETSTVQLLNNKLTYRPPPFLFF